jgi:hypothetical protein
MLDGGLPQFNCIGRLKAQMARNFFTAAILLVAIRVRLTTHSVRAAMLLTVQSLTAQRAGTLHYAAG